MKFDVITFGSALIDLFVDTDVSEKKGSMCYTVGSKILITDSKSDIGGGGTNTAVAFARLGLKTGYIGKLGYDINAKKILELLKKEKVKFLGVEDKNSLTDYAIVLDSREHDRTILTYKKLNSELNISEIKPRKLKTKWLYLSSMLGKSFNTQKILSQILVKKGVKIAYNPSEYVIKKYDIKPILNVCEILICNKEEAQLLVEKNNIKEKDLFKGLSKLGPKIIVITDKDNLIKAYNSKEDKNYSLRPHKIKVVERTGAGDAFASGFVAGQIVRKSIESSLRLGLLESESVIKYFGAKNKLVRMKLK